MKREDINNEIQKWIDEDLKNKAVLAILGENIEGFAYYSLNFNGNKDLFIQMLANSFSLNTGLRDVVRLALKASDMKVKMDKSFHNKRKVRGRK